MLSYRHPPHGRLATLKVMPARAVAVLCEKVRPRHGEAPPVGHEGPPHGAHDAPLAAAHQGPRLRLCPQRPHQERHLPGCQRQEVKPHTCAPLPPPARPSSSHNAKCPATAGRSALFHPPPSATTQQPPQRLHIILSPPARMPNGTITLLRPHPAHAIPQAAGLQLHQPARPPSPSIAE